VVDKGKYNILGIGVNAIDYEAATNTIITTAMQQQCLAVSALAVHGVMTGVLDPVHRYRLNHIDLVVPDGQPVRWALNILHRVGLFDRVYGPTLMLKVCEQATQAKLPIYLYGSRPEVLAALSTSLQQRFPGLLIAGSQPSRFRRISAKEKAQIVVDIIDSGAAIVFVGLGCPRQEVWVYEYRDVLPMPLLAVGAAFDFHAGLLAQAPAALQRLGLEWLYRFVHEPGRLWKRYVLLNPLYISLLILQATGLRTFDPAHAIPPMDEIRYG